MIFIRVYSYVYGFLLLFLLGNVDKAWGVRRRGTYAIISRLMISFFFHVSFVFHWDSETSKYNVDYFIRSSLETLLCQNPDHRAGLFGRVYVMDQRRVFFGSGPVPGAQVDERRTAGEIRDVQQLSNLIGRKHEH